MAGVINTGIGYRDRALSGFVRQAEQEQEINRANRELTARESSQRKSNQASMAIAGGMAGYAYGGGYGAAAGSTIGFLFGSLM
jgi:hypothetical protein